MLSPWYWHTSDHLDMRVENTIGALMVVVGTALSDLGAQAPYSNQARGSTTAPSPS